VTTTSERATATIPEREQPLSEQFRLVAKKWVDAEASANILEDTKSCVLAEMIAKHQLKFEKELAHNRAENDVKASPEWHQHVIKICEARRDANLLKMQIKYIDMRYGEWQSANATNRAEMKLR
jgi:hypothetical protein